MDSFGFQPIAFVKSSYKYKYDAPRQSGEDQTRSAGETQTQIIFEKGFNLEQGLKGLSGFKRIWLIYQFHQNKNWKPLVQTPREGEKQGVFATRSPYRPNPIGLSCVELLEVGKNFLIVGSHDLLDGTPILDIKPYLPERDSYEVENTSWVEGEELKEIIFTDKALDQLNWLGEKGLVTLKGFIVDQLKRDPINKNKKRVAGLKGNIYELSYRTWRIQFHFFEDKNLCEILNISSGYSLEELADTEDKYGDKELHKEFKDVL